MLGDLDQARTLAELALQFALQNNDRIEIEFSRIWFGKAIARLGYMFLGEVYAGSGRPKGALDHLASGIIELSEDEAYQWVWSKHLAMSYYSKPPMIAATVIIFGRTRWTAPSMIASRRS
jgi:hypothetical protein